MVIISVCTIAAIAARCHYWIDAKCQFVCSVCFIFIDVKNMDAF